jgi:hypothetical protein
MDRYIPNGVDGALSSALEYMQSSFTVTNSILGLIIALLAVTMMRGWGQIWVLTLVSAVVFVLVEHMLPILRGGAALRLPNVVAPEFWQRLAAAYVGLLVILAVFYFIKSTIIKSAAGGGAPAKAKH